MKSIKNILLAGLAAVVFSCQPNLSTPENTVMTFLSEVKKGNDPLNVCGYTEEIDSLRFSYGYHKHFVTKKADHERFEGDYSRYNIFADNCLPDIKKCEIKNSLPYHYVVFENNPKEFEGLSREISLKVQEQKVHFEMQKESDGNWRINGIIYW